jgi:AAA ATPase domain
MENGLAALGRPEALLGRADECVVLDGLIGDIRRGESRSLVLRGEAGIGKTALLEYLVASASDPMVVRAVGVESQMELAYAGLHQLCGPLLDGLESLPSPQRQALEIVFGLSDGCGAHVCLLGLGRFELSGLGTSPHQGGPWSAHWSAPLRSERVLQRGLPCTPGNRPGSSLVRPGHGSIRLSFRPPAKEPHMSVTERPAASSMQGELLESISPVSDDASGSVADALH